MAKTTVRLEGERTLLRRLERMEDELRAAAMDGALQGAAESWADRAGQRVPASAGPPTRGGLHLKNAIRVETKKREPDHVVKAVGPRRDQFHGIFVEVGTVHQPARPFLRPTFDERRRQALFDVAAALKRRLASIRTFG